MLNPKLLPLNFFQTRDKLNGIVSSLQELGNQELYDKAIGLLESLNNTFNHKNGIYYNPTDKEKTCIFINMGYEEVKDGVEFLNDMVGKTLMADGLGNIENAGGGIALGFLLRLSSCLIKDYPESYEWE